MLAMHRFNRLFQTVSDEPWRVLAAVGDSLLKDWEQSTRASWSHHADVCVSDKGITIDIPLPGRNPNDIEVAVEGKRLEVNTKGSTQPDGDSKVVSTERMRGEVSLAWNLPFEPKVDGTSVNYVNGVLRIEIEQAPSAQRRTLAVNAQ